MIQKSILHTGDLIYYRNEDLSLETS